MRGQELGDFATPHPSRYTVLVRRSKMLLSAAVETPTTLSSVNDSDNNGRQSFGGEAVSLKHSIVRNNSQLLDTGLTNEHPIERITVYVRQAAGC